MEAISLLISRLSLLLILGLSNGVLSSAPSDTGGYCLANSALPDYPQTVKRLMDSWSYRRLLGTDGVWSTVDADNDGITWSPVPLETCRERVSVSEPQNLPQDNWLITQYINKSIASQYNNDPVTIFINISYILDSSCTNVNCIPNFQLLYHLSNESSNTLASHTPGYTLISNVSSVDNLTLHMKTFSFKLDPKDTGFYIGVRDIGANITITRLFVYHLIGPAMQSGLTLFPETPAPTSDCINVTGLCVANADTSTGSLPVLRLNINGSWTYDDECMCLSGHELVVIEGLHQCQACTPSTYKPTLSNTACTSCPLNSYSTVHGASVCDCSNGFYRAPNDEPTTPCTGPPSAPVGIMVNTTTSTSSLISWGAPLNTGGRSDVYYDVYYYSTANATRVKANPQPLYQTSYKFTDLIPSTTYLVTVSAENGVSNQSSSTQRSVFIAITTPEGVTTTTTSDFATSTSSSSSSTTTTTTTTIIIMTTFMTPTTTSGLAASNSSSSKQIPGTTQQSTTTPTTIATPTATPTESGSNPVISIVAVLGGALGILLIVTLGAIGYFIFRKLRLKYMVKEETDHAPLVKYEVVSGEEGEEETRVQINPLAEDS